MNHSLIKRYSHSFFLLMGFFFILQASCGFQGAPGDTAQDGLHLALPKELEALNTTITASVMTSLDPSKRIPLSLNPDTNRFSGTIDVPLGSQFDLTVIYEALDPTSNRLLEIAHYTRQNITASTSETKVSYEGDESNWQTVFDLTPGTPNALNLDGDAFSNFVEIGYVSDPTQAQSQPEGPSVNGTRQDPLFGNLDVGLPPPGSDTVAQLTGPTDIKLTARTPFALKSFEIVNPGYGYEVLTAKDEALKTKQMSLKLFTDLFVNGPNGQMELWVRAVDTHDIARVTKFAFAVSNTPDSSPPQRLELTLENGALLSGSVDFGWELADASGIEESTISVLISNQDNDVSLLLTPQDEDAADPKHFKGRIVFNAADYPNGDYTLAFAAKDTLGHAYQESLNVKIANSTSVQKIGALPVIKYNGQTVQESVPETNLQGTATKVTLDGSKSIVPESGGQITYLWNCSAPGFNFTSSQSVVDMTLPAIDRSQDGLTIACTLTIARGSYYNSKQTGLNVKFVNQPPTLSSLSFQPAGGSPYPTPDKFKLTWAGSDADGMDDITGYDVSISRSKFDAAPQEVILCQNLSADSLISNQDLSSQCTLVSKDHGEMIKPLLLGANRAYTITVTAKDKDGANGTAAVDTKILDEQLEARFSFKDNLQDTGLIRTHHGTLVNDTDSSPLNNFANSFNHVMNQVLRLDKAKKHHITLANPIQHGRGDFTMAAWVKPASLGSSQSIIEQRNSQAGFEFLIQANGYFSFYTPLCGSVPSSLSVTANIWQHILVTRKSGMIRYYLNGELAGMAPCIDDINSNATLTLGCNSKEITCQEPFNGDLDEVQIYTKALSVDEVRRLCRAHDPTGTTCPHYQKPIILEPAPNVYLPPTRAFLSWRGERDADEGVLSPEVTYQASYNKDKDNNGVYDQPNSTPIFNFKHFEGTYFLVKEDLSNSDSALDKYLLEVVPVNSQATNIKTRHYFFVGSDQLSGWWRFNNNLTDVSGVGHVASMSATPPQYVDNLDLDQSLDLNAWSSYVQVPNHASLNFGINDFSISVYVNMHAFNKAQSFIEKRTPTNGFELMTSATNRILFYTANCGSFAAEEFIPTDGDWHHILATRASGLITLFLDGSAIGHRICTDNITNSATMAIGANSPGINGLEFLKANLDEIFLDNTSYSAGAVQNQFCTLNTLNHSLDQINEACLQ